jgi:RimJ/RimL family protein N-acetyltransferase
MLWREKRVIKLEYLEKKDFKKIIEWNNNKSADYLLQWSGPMYKYPLTEEQIKEFFLREVEKDNSNVFVYKIILVETDEMIGTIELRETDKDNKVGRVCRFLIGEENLRGRGIGKLALEKALRIGFEELKFENIKLGVYDFNHSAIKCYENAGFVKEKFLENSRKAENGYWNLYEMSISREKWEKILG